ncbi:MAG: cysteine hydrolase family protein [Ktedonobacterales bacterium]|jgi:nicotinamidase-related amidase
MGAETALVIIDVQAGLFDDDDAQDHAVLARITVLLARARASEAPVIYVQHDGGPGHPLAANTTGWQIHPAIAPRADDLIVHKRASDAFYKTSLQRALDARGVMRLVVAGAMTEYCVDTTCRRALSQGYDVTLVADGHATGDGDGMARAAKIAWHNAVLADLAHPDHQITVLPASAVTL